MAFDKQLLLRDGSVSGSLTASGSTPIKVLPGTPIRGLQCAVRVPAEGGSTPTLTIELLQAVSSGASFAGCRTYPATISAKGVYKFRFHLDKGYKALRARYTVAGTSADLGAVDIEIGL